MVNVLAGRCPNAGHPIWMDTDLNPPAVSFSCLCPGRADGIYAAAVGAVLTRDPHPNTRTTERSKEIGSSDTDHALAQLEVVTHVCKADG